MRILIVGAGPTGTVLAHLLKRYVSFLPFTITIWEKSGGCGGRMATSRFAADTLGGACSVDTGAQYITHLEKYHNTHSQFFNELTATSVLTPMQDEIKGARLESPSTQHFYSSKGLSAVAKWYISNTDVDLQLKTRLERVKIEKDSILVSSDNGKQDVYDYVILTIPVPQALSLTGMEALLDAEENATLQRVSFSSRFALVLKLPDEFDPPPSWTAIYVTDNPCIRFVCLDAKKRKLGKPNTLLVHTSVPYCLQRLEMDKDDPELVNDIVNNLHQVLPWLPPNSQVLKCHKWRYSQVHEAVPNEPGYMQLRSTSRLVLCGDSFTHSNLDGCLSSALKTAQYMKELFANSQEPRL